MRDEFNKNGYIVGKQIGRSLVNEAYEDIEKILSYGITSNALSLCGKLQSVRYIFDNYFLHRTLETLGISFPVQHYPVMHLVPFNEGYSGTLAHQDWASTQGSLDSITVWVPFTNTKDNYPLEVIPGSHLNGLLPGELKGSVLEVESKDEDFVEIKCELGEIIIMSGFLIHRTGKGDGQRLAVSNRFENADEPTFIKRGYPCAQKRTVDRNIIWKPTLEAIRKIYE